MRPRPLLALAATLLAAGAAHAQTSLTPERQQALVRMVRQDCGACHGMQLTGGLGPPLTAQALVDRPIEMLVATTLHGRPGTPMPGWHTMISEADALWIAQQLRDGFPQEAKARR